MGKAGGKQGESRGKAGPKKGKPVCEGGKSPTIYSTGVLRNRPELAFYNIIMGKQSHTPGGIARGQRSAVLEF